MKGFIIFLFCVLVSAAETNNSSLKIPQEFIIHYMEKHFCFTCHGDFEPHSTNILSIEQTLEWLNKNKSPGYNGYNGAGVTRNKIKLFMKVPHDLMPFELGTHTKLVKKQECIDKEVEETHVEYKIKDNFV